MISLLFIGTGFQNLSGLRYYWLSAIPCRGLFFYDLLKKPFQLFNLLLFGSEILQKLFFIGEAEVFKVEAGGYEACDKGVAAVGGGAKVGAALGIRVYPVVLLFDVLS
ncbi:MAG TPA: hypothetical protein VJ939_09335 [Bacteroidales bacterium]|nr:hypothetical protein [Bacteroidales bacterium]